MEEQFHALQHFSWYISTLHKHLLVLFYLIVDLSFSLIAFHLVDMHIKWKDFLICIFNSYVYVKSILYLMVKVDWYLHCLTEVMFWNSLIASAFDRHYWHLMYIFSLGSWLYVLQWVVLQQWLIFLADIRVAFSPICYCAPFMRKTYWVYMAYWSVCIIIFTKKCIIISVQKEKKQWNPFKNTLLKLVLCLICKNNLLPKFPHMISVYIALIICLPHQRISCLRSMEVLDTVNFSLI